METKPTKLNEFFLILDQLLRARKISSGKYFKITAKKDKDLLYLNLECIFEEYSIATENPFINTKVLSENLKKSIAFLDIIKCTQFEWEEPVTDTLARVHTMNTEAAIFDYIVLKSLYNIDYEYLPIHFIKKEGELFITGTTDKGYSIAYVPVPEDKLVFANPNENLFSTKDVDGTIKHAPTPTRLVFYCNFPITMPMMDFLESSNILYDLHLSNESKQISTYPLPRFDYLKMKELIIDLILQFNL